MRGWQLAKVLIMRPLAGVVLGLYRQTLTIELESGLIIETHKQQNLYIGDKCWVAYDFTRNAVRQVYRDNPDLELMQDTTEEIEEVVEETIEEESNIHPEDLELLLQEE